MWKVSGLNQSCIVQETGQLVGTVANVFDNGGNDLLHVLLDSSMEACNGSAKTNQLVWIPFVDAIVPDVDLERREMYITPPKGLLEVNMRADERSKKERRQLVRHILLRSFILNTLVKIFLLSLKLHVLSGVERKKKTAEAAYCC